MSSYSFPNRTEAIRLLNELPAIPRTRFEAQIADCQEEKRVAREQRALAAAEEQATIKPDDTPLSFTDWTSLLPMGYTPGLVAGGSSGLGSWSDSEACYQRHIWAIRRAHVQEVGETPRAPQLPEPPGPDAPLAVRLQYEQARQLLMQENIRQLRADQAERKKPTLWGLIGAAAGTFLAFRQGASLPTGAVLGGIAGVVASRMDTGQFIGGGRESSPRPPEVPIGGFLTNPGAGLPQ